jgi:hypothetical protein
VGQTGTISRRHKSMRHVVCEVATRHVWGGNRISCYCAAGVMTDQVVRSGLGLGQLLCVRRSVSVVGRQNIIGMRP